MRADHRGARSRSGQGPPRPDDLAMMWSHMGWLDKLLGREVVDAANGTTFSKRGWDSVSDERRAATTRLYLEALGKQLGVENQQVVPRPQDHEADLRGTLRGFPLRVRVSYSGSIGSVELKIGDTGHDFIDLEHDPEMAETPPQVDAFDESEKQVMVGPRVFFEGSSAEEEAALFRALPAELQERVVREMVRLRIRYFRSRCDDFDITMWDEASERNEPVAWLADTLRLAVDVTVARGQVPPGQEAKVPQPVERAEAKREPTDWARRVADSIGKQVLGAKIIENQDEEDIEVRWIESGVPVRIVVDYDFDDFDIEARVDGITADLALQYDEDVTIAPSRTGGGDDPWDQLEHHVFFAKHVFVCGTEALARSQAAMLRSLAPSLLDELVRTVETGKHDVWIDDEVLQTNIDDADEVTDGGAAAVRIAKLLARVAKALPRGAAAAGETAVRCSHCHALWFPSLLSATCVHCGARR